MSKINIVIRLQHWMDSVPGQTFLNYAYSWGASIVILGALFKLTHLPGGNIMLFLGMGTEVVVFFLSAFDRPFDKQEIGKELPHDYETDEEIAAKMGINLDEDDDNETANQISNQMSNAQPQPVSVSTPSTIVLAPQGGISSPSANAATTSTTPSTEAPIHTEDAESSVTTPQTDATTDTAKAAQAAINAMTGSDGQPFEAEAQRLAEIIRMANDELLHRAQAVLSPEMETATQDYIEKLRTLAETFKKVDEQSGRLARDSEEMENLNRTLTAINKTYDLHFKSISQQVGTIEQINDQTRRLAQQIEELNGVYGRMIQALTVNMRMQQPTQQQTAYQQPAQPQAQPQQPYAPNNGYVQQPNNAGCVPPQNPYSGSQQ